MNKGQEPWEQRYLLNPADHEYFSMSTFQNIRIWIESIESFLRVSSINGFPSLNFLDLPKGTENPFSDGNILIWILTKGTDPKIKEQSMGLYSGGLIIGRIFAT